MKVPFKKDELLDYVNKKFYRCRIQFDVLFGASDDKFGCCMNVVYKKKEKDDSPHNYSI